MSDNTGELGGVATAYHSQYWAHLLTLKSSSSDSIDNLSRSIANARVDLNPHQVDATLFAFRSPLSKGAILADEVGLSKSIEAGIVLSQKWAERRCRILLILPATLRSQRQQELEEKFYLPTTILETQTYNRLRREVAHTTEGQSLNRERRGRLRSLPARIVALAPPSPPSDTLTTLREAVTASLLPPRGWHLT